MNNIDKMIDGYPVLMAIRQWSLEVGHPTSCLIEMSVILLFLYALRLIYLRII
jgi:hypothetical protein